MPTVAAGSLTPASRSDEATGEATREGLVNGFITLVPSVTAVYLAMKNSPAFLKRTNFQSRTAIAIMPALFVAALTSELKLSHKMKEIAEESSHTRRTVQWAEEHHQAAAASLNSGDSSPSSQQRLSDKEIENQLTELYKRSVMESGVRIVPGNQLSNYHVAANYAASNPIKVLAAFAVPSVAWIFYGRTGKQHLDFSVKLLHTRVFGQFATISLLLSVMGFKEYMDKNGKFITQAEADARVEEMRQVRLALMERLEHQREHEMAYKSAIAQAHEEDAKDAAAGGKKAKKKKKRKNNEDDINDAINTIKE